MANVCVVEIRGKVPYDWSSNLTAEEAQCFAAWFLSPTSGLRMGYGREEMVPNGNGGKTSTWNFAVGGQEAVRHRALDLIVSALRRVGTVTTARVMDVEMNGRAGARWEKL